MWSTTFLTPATQRFVIHYYLIVLTSILAGVMLVLWFHWQKSLDQNLAYVVAAEMGIAAVGMLAMRRSVFAIHAIEQQLRSLPNQSEATTQLSLLAESGPLACGWNRVVEQLWQHRALTSLETKLSDLRGSSDEKQWNSIFQILPEGMAICDSDEQVLRHNNSLTALLGTTPDDELIGRPLLAILQTHFPSVEQVLNPTGGKLISMRAPLTCELRRGSQLAEGVLRVHRIPLVSEQGNPGGSLWCFRDVTQQRIAEECRTQFVFTATHELRTPLANIKAYADTLAEADDIDASDQKRFYNIISNEATRLARFVDDLLNISQLESGSVLATRSETDIERLIHETIENLRPQLLQKELRFETRLAPKLPTLVVDKDKLIAAMVNLLGNAIKYTPENGSVRLIVDQDETSLSFHVEDTGIGISTEELPRISEKFFRSQDQRVQNLVGSGLGLAFAQEVARLHGGQLSIESQLNKGSRFTLTLPLS